MVSEGQICTGYRWSEDSVTNENFESVYWTPRTSCSVASPTNQPATPRRGSITSRRTPTEAYTPTTFFDRYSLEEGLFSPGTPISDSSAFSHSREDSETFTFEDLPSILSLQSSEAINYTMGPCTPSRSIRTRTLSSSSRVFAMKLRASDSTENSQEVEIYKFMASNRSSCPFVQKVRIQESFLNQGEPRIDLENHPTSLAHPEVSRHLCLTQNPRSESAIQALRTLAAELYLALSFIHRSGIVHQDVKPESVMLSRDGHAVLGGFRAAQILPIVERPNFSSPTRLKAKFGKIVIRPEEVVNLTPVYAAPELMERNQDDLLEYDERVDWWGLGLTLYETVTGRLPFNDEADLPPDLLEVLNDEVDLIQKSDKHLCDLLRLLLVRDPALRICGEKVKSHPFFNPLSGLWGNIESLRHTPPCPRPPILSFFSRPFSVGHTVTPDELNSQSSFGNVTILQPRSPYRDSSSDECEMPQSPFPFGSRKTGVSSAAFTNMRRPTSHAFDDLDTDHPCAPCSYDFDPSLDFIIQETSTRMHPSFSIDTNNSSAQPFPSTASIVRIFYKDGTKQFPAPNPEDLEFIPCNEHSLYNFESSFNDSGLDLPLGESPESGSNKEGDAIRKPKQLQAELESEQILDPQVSNPTQPHKRPLANKIGVAWTFEEEIAISLLSAGAIFAAKGHKTSERVDKRRLSRTRLIAAASRRAIKAVGRRMSHIFLWR